MSLDYRAQYINILIPRFSKESADKPCALHERSAKPKIIPEQIFLAKIYRVEPGWLRSFQNYVRFHLKKKSKWTSILLNNKTVLEFQASEATDLHCPGLGLGASSKCSHRHSDILMGVSFTQDKWPLLLQEWNSRPGGEKNNHHILPVASHAWFWYKIY